MAILHEVGQFERFAKEQPNGTIHVKRWMKTTHSYEFGVVYVVKGTPEPAVYIRYESGPAGKFSFDSLTHLVGAGWIGD